MTNTIQRSVVCDHQTGRVVHTWIAKTWLFEIFYGIFTKISFESHLTRTRETVCFQYTISMQTWIRRTKVFLKKVIFSFQKHTKLRNSIPVIIWSQIYPWNPLRHKQLNERSFSIHIAPFWHGFESQTPLMKKPCFFYSYKPLFNFLPFVSILDDLAYKFKIKYRSWFKI